jgi:hypothetical protein
MRAFDFRNPMFVASLQPRIVTARTLQDVAADASVVLSLYKMVSAYAGSAIRVRRDSDNAEQDIGFSGNGLDISAITTFGGGANIFIKTWYDQSGNGYSYTQSSASAQAQIATGNGYTTTVITGSDSNPVASFDGGDYYDPSSSTSYVAKNGSLVVHCEIDNNTKNSFPYAETISAGTIFGFAFNNPSSSLYSIQHWNNGAWKFPFATRAVSNGTMASYIGVVDSGGNSSGAAGSSIYGYENNSNTISSVGDVDTTLAGNTQNGARFGGLTNTTAYNIQANVRTFMSFTSVISAADRVLLNTLTV